MRRLWMALLCIAAVSGTLGASAAETFPAKPLRLVVPYPPGGSTDLMARTLQEPLAKLLGQPVIVDNRPGAAGAIGSREVASAAPDGYTLVFSNNGPNSIVPALQKDAGYESIKSFSPVSQVALAPLVLVVHSSVPADNVADFIAYAKAQPDGLFYASAGPGSLGHLSTELFAARAGIKLNHVPYKGQAPTTMAVLAGDVKVLLTTTSQAMNEFIQDRKLKLLGVSSSEPSSVVPNARPIREAVPGFAIDVWFGILAPTRTPAAVVNKLNQALATVLTQEDVRKRFAGFGYEAKGSTPEGLGKIIAAEVPEWAKIVSENNIRAE